MSEDVGELVGRVARVERHDDGADRRDRLLEVEDDARVRRDDGDAIARLDAAGEQSMRQVGDAPRPLAVGELDVALRVYDGQLFREDNCRAKHCPVRRTRSVFDGRNAIGLRGV